MQISDSIVEFTSDNGRLYHCRIETASAPQAKIFRNFKLQNDVFLSKTVSQRSQNALEMLKIVLKVQGNSIFRDFVSLAGIGFSTWKFKINS